VKHGFDRVRDSARSKKKNSENYNVTRIQSALTARVSIAKAIANCGEKS
jgi:hypothetical protein